MGSSTTMRPMNDAPLRTYHRPALVDYGRVSDLTRGSSGSMCDGNSGNVGASMGCTPEPGGMCPMAGCQG